MAKKQTNYQKMKESNLTYSQLEKYKGIIADLKYGLTQREIVAKRHVSFRDVVKAKDMM